MGLFKKKPAEPDFRDFATNALAQTLLASDVEAGLRGPNLMATDEMLRSYWKTEIDWRGIWKAASERRSGVPPYEALPYWSLLPPMPTKVPITVVAFWGTAARLQVAEDPETPWSIIATMAGDPLLEGRYRPEIADPDPEVRRIATARDF